MQCALISIGDEILIGQVTDTNAVWISKELNKIGIRVGEMVSISDEPGHISATIERLRGKYDLLIMTGGLGPTKDDLTKETLAKYYHSSMVVVPEVLERITAFFKERGRTMILSNTRQAEIPEACEALTNRHGTAPGMWFKEADHILVSLPGVPYEMKGLMEEEVLPRLRKEVDVPNVVHRTIMTQGVPESYLAEILDAWETALPECVKLAYLPRPGIVRLRLTVVDKCAEKAEVLLKEHIDKLLVIIPQHIFGYDDITLEESLGLLLREKELSISTAESCTGGKIAALLTSIAGSSDYFSGSVVAYSDEVKTGVLGVDDMDIQNHGAVSKKVVVQMAAGVMKTLGTNCSIATSGIAGPGGGSSEKPVGTTWICVAYKDKFYAKEYRFGGTRERIIAQASFTGMQLLRRLILGSLDFFS